MSRRTRRRRPKRAERPEPVVTSTVDRPINFDRLRQLFANYEHRGTKLFDGYVLSPHVVDAASPEEMVAATERATIRATTKPTPR